MTWSSLSSFGVVAFCLPWLVHRNIFIFFYFFFFFLFLVFLSSTIQLSTSFSLLLLHLFPSPLICLFHQSFQLLSPGSFILSLSLFSLSHPSLLSFPHNPFLTSPSPFPIFLPCDFQPAKCYPHRFLSTLWSTLASASRLLQQHNLPQPTQGLQRT